MIFDLGTHIVTDFLKEYNAIFVQIFVNASKSATFRREFRFNFPLSKDREKYDSHSTSIINNLFTHFASKYAIMNIVKILTKLINSSKGGKEDIDEYENSCCR